MSPNILDLKKNLRREMILRRRQVKEETIREISLSIVPRVLDFIEQKVSLSSSRPLTIMSYMSCGQEFPTKALNHAILEKGWRLVLPYTDSDFHIIACESNSHEGLRRSRMGIEEPDPEVCPRLNAGETDLILLPGIAFDRSGVRLGYGKGCYDQFLSSSKETLPLTAALAWSFQIVDRVPSEDHDLPCDYLFTEDELIPCNSSSTMSFQDDSCSF